MPNRCAARSGWGFARLGTFDVVFGRPPNETYRKGVALVLAGMEWREGVVVLANIGEEEE